MTQIEPVAYLAPVFLSDGDTIIQRAFKTKEEAIAASVKFGEDLAKKYHANRPRS